MYLKKTISTRNLLSKFLPIIGIIGLSAQLTAHAADEPSLPATTDAQAQSTETKTSDPQSNTPDAKTDDKLNPTQDVAGGVGKKGFKPPDYAVLPTGKTLPEGIFRASFITANTFGNFGYDKDGKQGKYGIDYNRWATGTQIEYGLNNSVSLAIGIPYIISNHATMDGSAFQSTEFYNKYYNESVSQLASHLAGSPYCPGMSQAACVNNINSGNGGGPFTLTLPTGESLSVAAGTSFKTAISNAIIKAATPSTGASGLGDIQVGFLWSAISEDSPYRHVPLYFAIGGGVRLPTGDFNLPSALRATGGDGTLITGGGTYDALLRWNLDYIATPGVILSWQHQMEVSLTSADLGRSSMLDPTQKNEADPSAKNPKNGVAGDGINNTLKFSRKGVHEIGFVQAAWGVGNIAQKMKWLGLYTQAKYNIAAQAYLNNMPIYAMGDQFYLDTASVHNDYGYEQYYSAVMGTKLSGLPYMIPVEVSAELEYPFAGRNRINSPMNAQAVLSVYF